MQILRPGISLSVRKPKRNLGCYVCSTSGLIFIINCACVGYSDLVFISRLHLDSVTSSMFIKGIILGRVVSDCRIVNR